MNLHKIDYPIGRRLPPATWFVSLRAVSRLNNGTEKEHSVRIGAPRHRSARQRRYAFPSRRSNNTKPNHPVPPSYSISRAQHCLTSLSLSLAWITDRDSRRWRSVATHRASGHC
ncbi:hypothetical protein CCHR01_19622 [Colletotrichum chrysophilum]|uniref:Uncharacterized protein n=1 Tax=Colletotrichum chrysophilum TaxID=1836956 RepID=A0AAD8ZXZ2_9PEZI|nr:hypothetical protein CCHR01_19622 [Colletotrichum chrysophilum]